MWSQTVTVINGPFDNGPFDRGLNLFWGNVFYLFGRVGGIGPISQLRRHHVRAPQEFFTPGKLARTNLGLHGR